MGPERSFVEPLGDGWLIQSSSLVPEKGAGVSSADYEPDGWCPARVPSTVLGALVVAGEYPDLYQGMNLDEVPRERFSVPWWYRREIELPDPLPASVRLRFEGINYRAGVWLNGGSVAFAHEVVGAYRRFELDVSPGVRPGTNVLAVEVHPPQPGDYTVGFADWAPRPPDESMGLFRPVELRTTGVVSLEDPFVETWLSPDHDRAALLVRVWMVNHSGEAVVASVSGEIESVRFSAQVELEAGERREVHFSPDIVSGLEVQHPRLWWPARYGEPSLYRLGLEAAVDGVATDARETTFGIREVGDYINDEGHRGYTVNGVPILIRGAGWTDDLLLAEDERNLEAQMQYVRQMDLNTVRLEGFWGCSQRLYDLADRLGILLMVGWSCHWEWEGYLGRAVDDFGPARTEPEMELLDRSLGDQVRWLRHHPSILVWVLGSDTIPRPALEQRYRATLADLDPTRPCLAGCKERTSALSGPTAVKMRGPYDYVTPAYWYLDTALGGAFGFNTETGPGPQPPALQSLRDMLGEGHLWPIDEVWDFHCARNEFSTLDRYRVALDRRYGEPRSVEEFARVAQAASYEAVRAMFEAFGVNRPRATGVIQWMLNACWPSLYWQLYGHDLVPNGAFYGTQAACRPRSLVYHYGDHGVYAVNDRPEPAEGWRAEVRVLDVGSREVLHEEVAVDLPALSSQRILDLAGIGSDSPVRFVFLTLREGDEERARNVYWLSSREDVPDWEKGDWIHTPGKEYADLTALRDLPRARVEATLEGGADGEDRRARVTLRNRSDVVAFFLELTVAGEGGRGVAPIRWDENDVSLLPRENRTLEARFAARDLGDATPRLVVTGFNLQPADDPGSSGEGR